MEYASKRTKQMSYFLMAYDNYKSKMPNRVSLEGVAADIDHRVNQLLDEALQKGPEHDDIILSKLDKILNQRNHSHKKNSV